ncbi:hypothetical protein QBC34DRAFT_462428 [Podospora aff. communis PSN243]|uniref:Uncharacterized protein n=1 Tax=Podospora aff. communis PSN243 TaxID=3040156 RepID=A0AAV9GQT3_9PEZI|nr:hypothetical protein QBC34DRAFT_462428 [Podospora aff. communis PSN243]
MARGAYPGIFYCLHIAFQEQCIYVGGSAAIFNQCYNVAAERRNQMSSLTITEPGTWCAFYDDVNCGGASFSAAFRTDYFELGGWNDRVESCKCWNL